MSTPNAIVVTRPNHDLMMTYLAAWSEEVVQFAKSKGMHECDLNGPRASRATFESYIAKHDPALVVLNGHGDTMTICGQENEALLDMSSAIGNRVIYARSCDAGETLGPHLATQGATFIGYARAFGIMHQPAKTAHPLDDDMAALFLRPSNLVITTLLKGHTAKEAYDRSREVMSKTLNRMLSSVATDEERAAAPVMWRNMKWQVLCGDPTATVA